jgi:hypothetical protein
MGKTIPHNIVMLCTQEMFLELKFLTFTETKPNLWVHLSRIVTYAMKVVLNNIRNQNLQSFQAKKYVKSFDIKFLNDMNVSNVTHDIVFEA